MNAFPPGKLLLHIPSFLGQLGERLAHIIEVAAFRQCAGHCTGYSDRDGGRSVFLVGSIMPYL